MKNLRCSSNGLGFLPPFRWVPSSVLSAAAACTITITAGAAPVDIMVTVENLAPANSISFAPLRFGFGNGMFDAFNAGGIATAPIISVAEGGSGVDWFPAFAAADPTAALGSTSGALLPGATFSTAKFRIDTTINSYFTFGSMVVPSNDFFIGNDDPKEYRLFDAGGALVVHQINQTASDIWNAGSEAFDPANAAFLVAGNNSLRTPENSTVAFNFSELSGFNGLTTAPGYVFDGQLGPNSDIYRITFSVSAVPEPAESVAMVGVALGIGACVWRRRRNAMTPTTQSSRVS